VEWTHEQKSAVWRKAKAVGTNDPNVFRQDECGAWIKWLDYGNRESQYGWEIDHIIPKARGGGDSISNLRPLQWQNNASKGDGRLVCAVRANGANNVSV
jgi:5-methylcytosine-specific restriction endonuclease McrA